MAITTKLDKGFLNISFSVACRTWLTGNSQSQQSDAPPPSIPSEPMTLRYGLCDIQRTGLSVWLAPGNHYAAVADNLGRVILVDCTRCIAIRVWKGYRDAQCSFIKTTEKMPKNSEHTDRRHALFLVIFAPRRSCLEIWCLQRGPKVAAFNASKYGQLIYNSHSLMGVTGTSAKVKYSTNTCIFLDASDQSLKEISVPFHCALNDSNSKAAKDLHLMRRIKMCLRSGDGSEEDILNEIVTSCRSFQTNEIRLQCLEMLGKNNKVKPNVFQAILSVFSDHLREMETDESEDTEDMTSALQHQQLTLLLANYTKLTNFYVYTMQEISPKKIKDEEQQDIVADTDDPNEINIEENTRYHLVETLKLSDTELENLQKLIDLSILERSSQTCPKVTFHQKVLSNSFVDYLSAFDCHTDDLICLKNADTINVSNVGADIFRNFLEKGRSLCDFLDESIKSNICGEDLMKLFLVYWLHRPFRYTKM